MRRKKMKSMPCVIDGCGGFYGAPGSPGDRGLCKVCHNYASQLIRENKTTWDELEKLGLCRPLVPIEATRFLKVLLERRTTVTAPHEMDAHAAHHRLGHWKCLDKAGNSVWRRDDGETVTIDWTKFDTYIDHLQHVDSTSPLRT